VIKIKLVILTTQNFELNLIRFWKALNFLVRWAMMIFLRNETRRGGVIRWCSWGYCGNFEHFENGIFGNSDNWKWGGVHVIWRVTIYWVVR